MSLAVVDLSLDSDEEQEKKTVRLSSSFSLQQQRQKTTQQQQQTEISQYFTTSDTRGETADGQRAPAGLPIRRSSDGKAASESANDDDRDDFDVDTLSRPSRRIVKESPLQDFKLAPRVTGKITHGLTTENIQGLEKTAEPKVENNLSTSSSGLHSDVQGEPSSSLVPEKDKSSVQSVVLPQSEVGARSIEKPRCMPASSSNIRNNGEADIDDLIDDYKPLSFSGRKAKRIENIGETGQLVSNCEQKDIESTEAASKLRLAFSSDAKYSISGSVPNQLVPRRVNDSKSFKSTTVSDESSLLVSKGLAPGSGSLQTASELELNQATSKSVSMVNGKNQTEINNVLSGDGPNQIISDQSKAYNLLPSSTKSIGAALKLLGMQESDSNFKEIENAAANWTRQWEVLEVPLAESKLEAQRIVHDIKEEDALRVFGFLPGYGEDDSVVEEGEDEADDDNESVCDACGEGGLLYLCDSCPRAFHGDCLDDEPPSAKAGEEEEQFICPICLGEDFIDDGSDEAENVAFVQKVFEPLRRAREERVRELKMMKMTNPNDADDQDGPIPMRYSDALANFVRERDEKFEDLTASLESGGKFTSKADLKMAEQTLINEFVRRENEEEAKRKERMARNPSPARLPDEDATATPPHSGAGHNNLIAE